jgi:hypothetical protein
MVKSMSLDKTLQIASARGKARWQSTMDQAIMQEHIEQAIGDHADAYIPEGGPFLPSQEEQYAQSRERDPIEIVLLPSVSAGLMV